MNCVSGASEQDAGTRYPTQIFDTNGNWLTVNYMGPNASSRITTIADVRGGAAYTFSYDGTNHLTGITNSLGSGENFAFAYATGVLYSPFAPQLPFGSGQTLTALTLTGLNLTKQFVYGANGSGELTKVILPYGGEMRWDYRDFTYSGATTLREVSVRYLVPSVGATPLSYALARDDAGDAGRVTHLWTTVTDAGLRRP